MLNFEVICKGCGSTNCNIAYEDDDTDIPSIIAYCEDCELEEILVQNVTEGGITAHIEDLFESSILSSADVIIPLNEED